MVTDSRTSDYVCFDCGKKFLTDEDKKVNQVSTFFIGICGVCGDEKPVTHIRNYHYLRVK